MSRTTVTDGCWECDLGLDTNGYPNVREAPLPGKRYGRLRKVSILMYEAHNGPVPEGLVVRHTCHNVRCIRPEHLIVGTHGDNANDKVQAGRSYVWSEHHVERKGHEYERATDKNGKAYCVRCRRETSYRYWERNRDKVNARQRDAYARRSGIEG
jgi:hypothetical protein